MTLPLRRAACIFLLSLYAASFAADDAASDWRALNRLARTQAKAGDHDGLVRDGDSLVAVQNGTSPPRVIRFSDDLARQQVLESGTPGLGEPTHAVVVGCAPWFIADVGWDLFEESGQRKPGAPPSHAELRRIALPDRFPDGGTP